MGIQGKWENAYGSLMELEVGPAGEIWGSYSSTTGSTGTYIVVGQSSDQVTAGNGQAFSICIYWRSIAGGTRDPSWHWVSSLSGQWIVDRGEPSLILEHLMVATDDFPGVGNVGTYIDKLIYLPSTKPRAASPRLAAFDRKGRTATDPVLGTWQCLTDPGLSFVLTEVNPDFGFTHGTLFLGGGQFPLYGVYDADAGSMGLSLEGLALAAPNGGTSTLGFGGSLNLQNDLLTLTNVVATGTAPGSTYMQATISQLSFRKTS